jgi:hypothetical protein
MRYFFRATNHQTARLFRTTYRSATLWFWQILVIMTCVSIGLPSDSAAAVTTSRESRTFTAVQGGSNPPSQWFEVYSGTSRSATLTATDNATWLRVSPSTTTIISTARLTVYVNTTGLTAGTYKANITIKVGTWGSKVVPVTLNLSPASTGGGGGGTTSTATLRWNAVTSTPVTGYKVYVGEAPRQYSRSITVGNVTSSTINSLTVGRTYYFTVTAYNSAGESPRSNEATKTIR